MFYSHELLTSRKYGVATVWLVATLGSKSGLRRVTRKAIQGVDIEKACATVSDGEGQPLALRLQSNLLYGISRVYFQQCEYVLVDAQHAQNSLRTLWKHVAESQGLDPNAGKAKPENLIIPDDPGFLPDDLIPDPTIDLSFFESSVVSSSIPSILSGGRFSSQSNLSAIGLELPSSISEAVQGPIAPAVPGSVSHIGVDTENLEGFDPNIPFGFDEDGNLFDFQPLAPEVELPTRARSDSQFSARARLAFEDDLRTQQPHQDVDLSLIDNHHQQILPEAEPFPTGQIGPGGENATPEVKRTRRPIPIDKTLQIRLSELASRDQNYVSNMEVARKAKTQRKAVYQARKNAFHYVLGRGLGDTGLLHGNLVGPLAMFSGEALYEALTGSSLDTIAPAYKKRSADPDATPSINKRARTELGRGLEDDTGDALPLFEDSIELAREAPPLPLYDEHSSQMPWNQPPSSRAASRQASVLRGNSANTFHQRSLDRGRGERKQTPSSPLRGRGTRRQSSLLGSLGRLGLASDHEDMPPMSGPDVSLSGGFDVLTPTPGSQPMPWSTTIEVDAKRFLSFISANANPVTADESTSEDVAKAITFNSLLPPADHTRLVAAQGFIHLLTLANEGYIVAKQDDGADIWMGVKTGYEDIEFETAVGEEMKEGEGAMELDAPKEAPQVEEEERQEAGGHKGSGNDNDSDDSDQEAAIARLRF